MRGGNGWELHGGVSVAPASRDCPHFGPCGEDDSQQSAGGAEVRGCSFNLDLFQGA